MKLRYKYSNIPALKNKCKAWEELFGSPPQVRLFGTWKDKDELVFCERDTALEISERGIKCRVDGDVISLKGTGSSEYTLELG